LPLHVQQIWNADVPWQLLLLLVSVKSSNAWLMFWLLWHTGCTLSPQIHRRLAVAGWHSPAQQLFALQARALPAMAFFGHRSCLV